MSSTAPLNIPRAGQHDSDARIAVLLPCFNEAATIGAVIDDFRACVPAATIYVYDNNSSDDSAAIARSHGATVMREREQGKGHVVRRMFADIDADIYILADSDATYDAASAPRMVQMLVEQGLDMVTARRMATSDSAFRAGHLFGNRFLTSLVARSFGKPVSDMLSGFRVLSRRFVKSFPALSGGFEIETELTVHALELGMPQAELDTPYHERPSGSYSKLSTWRDGTRILRQILVLIKEERPLFFFSSIFGVLVLLSVVLALPVIAEFLATGLVPRLPTAVLSTGLMLLAFISLACGLILDTVTRGRREIKRLHYLRQPGPGTGRCRRQND